MEQQAKRAIKSFVLRLRQRLEDDIAIQLKRYGFAGERWLPLERLPHIQQDDQATIDHFRLKAALEQHLRRIGAEPGKATAEQRAEAVDWFVREVGFTQLNRLVALKCLELRGLIPEIITTRDAYGGRSRAHYDYRNSHPQEGGQPDDALPAAIRHICREVHAEFKFLFDVGDPATGDPPPANSILWPSHPVLKECIGLINGLDETADHQDGTLWAEDEIIGWIYQFYNAEEKEAIRKRGRPRRPAEVAIINQFFTPRWIVKFLVDNTLGRLWLEMRPDSERVRAKCDYLVPEPLGGDEDKVQGDGEREFRLDPDSPINEPKAPPRREPKRPQDIRLIDPACGTMHFGHYAFEVFQEIYRDAREHSWVSGDDALSDEDTPDAILRHNLYGVDIDLRAVQLAGLSLFIKAKTANPKAHISHVNLVVADAVLPADGSRQRFLNQYKDDKVVQDAVRQVLEEMANVAEVGSLLRVEERLREILAKAGHAAVEDWDQDRLQELPGFEPSTRQLSLAEVPGAMAEQWGARYTVSRLLDDLRAFAAEALQAHNLNAQLFAQEAKKTVHLLDVFLNQYDVVVMNPPYGDTTKTGASALKNLFAHTTDLFCLFVERGLVFSRYDGYVGALTSSAFLRYKAYKQYREDVLLGDAKLVALADLGWGILDEAQNKTAAYVVGPRSPSRTQTAIVFFRLVGAEQPGEKLAALVRSDSVWESEAVYVKGEDHLQLLPNSPLCYYAPDSFVRQVTEFDPLSASAHVCAGAAVHKLFYRFWWEIPSESLGVGRKWIPFANAGPFTRYYRDNQTVIDWENNGERVKDYTLKKYPYLGDNVGWRIQNEGWYYRQGLTYGVRTERFNVQYLPHGQIFSGKGQAIFPRDASRLWYLLGYSNSAIVDFFLGLICGLHKNYPYVRLVPDLNRPSIESTISLWAKTSFAVKSAWDTGNETCTRFDTSWLLQAHRSTLLADFQDFGPSKSPTNRLANVLDYVRDIERAADARLQELQAKIDETVYGLYEISPEDRALIEQELGDRPLELVWPQMEGKSDKEKRREHVRRLISYFLLQALKEDRDGIVPITPGTGQPTALDEVRRWMEGEFGEGAAFRMESEIQQVLGKNIADWLDGPLFKWHIKLYKRRPIIWHLASPRNAFGCFVYLHKLDRDTLRKVQTQYLWPRRRAAEAALEAAKADKSPRRIEKAEAVLDDLAEFEKRLLSVIQAQVECDIPDWAEGPFRGDVYDPVLDDGVKVNITPLQQAALLRHRKVV